MDYDYKVIPGVTDYVGKKAGELKEKKLFLFDMDGTIYEEDRLFDSVLEFLKHIEDNGGRYVFITNNSSKSVEDYIKKVQKLGIKADKDNFFTSAQATVLYLKEHYPHTTVYCQGTDSLVKEFEREGFEVVTEVSDKAGVVVVGFDTELTYEKLCSTCEILKRDIPYIATNLDLRCPVSFGYIPDCGSICNLLENVTDKKPIYIGKPEPVMVDMVREKFGYTKEETVVIGDRLYTDVATGINAGVTSICVLTGEAKLKDAVLGEIKPTYIFKDIKEIYEVIK